MTLEVLIPVRNPTEVFAKTIDSLAAQTDKNFAVLISDNFSTQGAEHLEAALKKLSAAGIGARKIQPPGELERVEHWNWLHYQATADWLKPLFVGDWLEPGYMARLREVVTAEPACRYVFTNGIAHFPSAAPYSFPDYWTGRFNPPTLMQAVVLRVGMQFGPPSAAAYERTAFVGLGGYATNLPIVADSLLFCSLAARFGAAGIREKLFHMNIHDARFSTLLPGKRRDTFRETMTYLYLLGYHAWTERDHFPVGGYLRQLARESRHYWFRY